MFIWMILVGKDLKGSSLWLRRVFNISVMTANSDNF